MIFTAADQITTNDAQGTNRYPLGFELCLLINFQRQLIQPMDKTITTLRQAIAEAKQREQQQGQLGAYFETHQQRLHAAVSIARESPKAALLGFVVDYVNAVPEHLQALYTLSHEAGIDAYTGPFLKLAVTYFLNPPDLLNAYDGLHAALCKAYLAHRLMEEVNDQVMNLGGAALAPMDMSTANLIALALIGDDFANQLDHLVLLTVETTAADKTVFEQDNVRRFMEQRRFKGWDDVLKAWPCFTKDCGVDLQIGGQ